MLKFKHEDPIRNLGAVYFPIVPVLVGIILVLCMVIAKKTSDMVQVHMG